ncbi:hypothetical protein EDF58_103452 [Novosphingobium sp. PhB57]|uniref:hypothetical protein n=1 Tax=Novosphingobium sp. PhB57 TaxID=2485107 RepID=UPI0010E02D8B|nr:hypothetical protein [Novosphingobium sp. PhB57]TCU58916.1 hypothetical protein EDF58_103452 [Novosphingobium sp. PhB57]
MSVRNDLPSKHSRQAGPLRIAASAVLRFLRDGMEARAGAIRGAAGGNAQRRTSR